MGWPRSNLGISILTGSAPGKVDIRGTLRGYMEHSSDGRVVWSVCLLSCRLGFDSESGQTNDFNIGIHSFPA